MTQRASLLAVATVFVDFIVREGGLIRETKVPMQELELKMEGGGIIAGFYGIYVWQSCTEPPNLSPPIFLQ